MAKKAKAKKPTPSKTPRRKTTPIHAPSAQATQPDVPDGEIVLDKLGVVQRWRIPNAAYQGQQNLRIAYRGGFQARAQAWLEGRTGDPVPDRFARGSTLQRAFEDGYHDAKRQEGAGATSKQKTLVGR